MLLKKEAARKKIRIKFFCGKGIYLLLTEGGHTWWRFKYRFAHKENSLSLGVYPEVSWEEVETRALAYRRLLRDGINPSNRKNHLYYKEK